MSTQIPQDDGTRLAEAAPGEQDGVAARGSGSAPDAWLERRLRVFERALTALEARSEAMQREHTLTIARMEERIRALMGENAAAQAAQEAVESEEVTQATVNGGTRTIRSTPAHDLEAAISAAPVVAPDIPPHDTATPQTAGTSRDDLADAALTLPVQTPSEQAVSREEMAQILKGARQAVRTGEEDVAPRRFAYLKLPRLRARLRWLSLGCFSLVALFIGAGLMLGESASAVQSPTGSSTAHRHVSHDAFQRMIARADFGDADAQAGMALAYLRGTKVSEDTRVAMLWAGQAAVRGNPVGQYLMGTFYHRGDVVQTDPGLAFRWFLAAAQAGNLKAMHNLGVAYAEGLGTPKDAAQAAHWFRRAAERGYVDSAFDLAVLYERGDGVPQNGALALQWYEVAAAAGDAPSRKRADFLRHQISHVQVAQADQGARAFVRLTPLPDANRLPTF